MSLLEVMGLSHSYGDKQLYTNASFELYKGEHMGVVGQNGAGKSTLLKILMGEVVPDNGYIKWQSNIKVGILNQYAHIIENYPVYLKTAFNDLYDVERKLNDVYMEMASIQNDKLMKKAAYYQDVLEEKDFYNIESNIAKVATGLGITAIGMDKILKELSGGQRAKVILAKLLLEKPDILILDEPTNFLVVYFPRLLIRSLCLFPFLQDLQLVIGLMMLTFPRIHLNLQFFSEFCLILEVDY